MNKLLLVEMQVSSEGPSSGVTIGRALYFSGSCIPTNESLFINYVTKKYTKFVPT